MNFASKAAARLNAAAGLAACAALAVMMLIAVVDVVLRTVFNAPLMAASEVIEIAMVLTIFLMYPRVSARGMHISIDLLDEFMPDPARRVQHVFAALLGAAVFMAVAWRIGHLSADAWASEEVTGILGVPLGHVYAFICAMSALTACSFLATLPAAFCRGPFVHPSMSLDEVPE